MYEGTWQEADGGDEEVMKSGKDGNLEPRRTKAAAYDVAHPFGPGGAVVILYLRVCPIICARRD